MKLKVIGAFVMVLGIAGAAAAYQPQGGPAPRGDFRRGPELSREDRAHLEAMRKVRAELRDEPRKEKAEYDKKVGQVTMQVDWLKKKSEEICGPDYESKFSPKPVDD